MLKKKLLIYSLFISLFFIGLILQINPSGGAKYDYQLFEIIIRDLSVNLSFDYIIDFFLNYYHSPVFYIFASIAYKLFPSFFFLKILNVVISSILPYLFFLILRIKYKNSSFYIFFLSLIIFYSPYFIGTAIWLHGDNLSLVFFSLSIIFYLKTTKNNNLLNPILSFLFLALCCYVRYYYCIFAVYFLYNNFFSLSRIKFLYLLLFNFILILPALIFLFFVSFKSNALIFNNYLSFNYFSNFFVICSVFLFYLIPIFYFNLKKIFIFYKKNYKFPLILFLIFFSIAYVENIFNLFLINLPSNGGGVFIKLFRLLNFNTNIALLMLSYFSILILDFLFIKKRTENYFLLFILLLCFPNLVIYQKYLDPLFLIFLFGLIKSDLLFRSLSTRKINIFVIHTYFLLFLIFSIFYYFNYSLNFN